MSRCNISNYIGKMQQKQKGHEDNFSKPIGIEFAYVIHDLYGLHRAVCAIN